MTTTTEESQSPTSTLVLSVSRLTRYNQCPHSYYLKYVEDSWERPAAWLVQGLAVHEAAEFWEKSGRQASRDETMGVCRDRYETHINRMLADTPNLDYWFWSGPYNGQADIERRLGLAEIQIVRYLEWAEAHPEVVPWTTPGGELAVELPFELELSPGVNVRGFIDQVVQDEYGLVVVDLKTGNKPGDVVQLETYATVLNKLWDVDVNRGWFWMGKSGKATIPFYFDGALTHNNVTNQFVELHDNITASRFDANPGDHCRFCSVSSSCKFVNE